MNIEVLTVSAVSTGSEEVLNFDGNVMGGGGVIQAFQEEKGSLSGLKVISNP